jgi:predicted RNase H-like HicB family nuclease
MALNVAIEETEEGYHCWCPSLPGCWSQGGREAEALENIQAAIEEYFDAL